VIGDNLIVENERMANFHGCITLTEVPIDPGMVPMNWGMVPDDL